MSRHILFHILEISNRFYFSSDKKSAPHGSNYGEREVCRSCDPLQMENLVVQDSSIMGNLYKLGIFGISCGMETYMSGNFW